MHGILCAPSCLISSAFPRSFFDSDGRLLAPTRFRRPRVGRRKRLRARSHDLLPHEESPLALVQQKELLDNPLVELPSVETAVAVPVLLLVLRRVWRPHRVS